MEKETATAQLRSLLEDPKYKTIKLKREAGPFTAIAVCELARVEIADRDYTEGSKKHFTYEEALKTQEQFEGTGWRLPTRREWGLICENFACGGDGNLKGQLLIDKLGLGLNGWQDYEDQLIRSVGVYGYYWSSVADSATNARHLLFNAANVYPSYGSYRGDGFSVRLIRDIRTPIATGYKSNIALLTTKEGWQNVRAAMFEAGPQQAEACIQKASFTHLASGKYILFKIEQVERHEYDGGVFITVIHELDRRGIPYSYVRVGESASDVEAKVGKANCQAPYRNMPRLGVERKIRIN